MYKQLSKAQLPGEVLLDILNGIDSFVYVTEPETDKILFINDKLAAHCGVNPQEIIGTVCGNILATEQDGRHYRQTESLINWLGGTKARLQHALDISDLIEAETALEEKLKQSGEIEQALRLAKEQAERSSRAKSDFLSHMSHEMRTPLNAIIGMTSIALGSQEPQQKEYCLHRISAASDHLLGVINDVLDLSKIEANKFEMVHSEFIFHDMITEVENVVRFRMDEKRQQFIIDLEPDIPEVIISDQQRLKQVIVNLLGNAVKFTPEGGIITLSARKVDEDEAKELCTIEFAVADTGIGLSKEQCSRLFQPFEQADSSTSRKFGGTGLGLAISKSITKLLGGNIWVEAQEGQGSCFFFTIQAQKGRNTPASLAELQGADDEGLVEENAFSNYRILLAEDIEINREIVTVLLKPSGIAIDYAENGRQACNLFAANPQAYNMIFMDIQMPEMDGYEATREIRQLDTPFALTVPIVAMTANVFREDVQLCLDAGMNDHVGKPLDIKDVVAKLKQYLPMSHYQQ